MQRRELFGGVLAAALIALGSLPAKAQDPIVFGVITPLSPPSVVVDVTTGLKERP